jgi:hypothetical protein
VIIDGSDITLIPLVDLGSCDAVSLSFNLRDPQSQAEPGQAWTCLNSPHRRLGALIVPPVSTLEQVDEISRLLRVTPTSLVLIADMTSVLMSFVMPFPLIKAPCRNWHAIPANPLCFIFADPPWRVFC